MIKGIELSFKLIFLLLETKLRVLKEYINNSIKKEIIKESILLIKILIFFIGKKNKGVRSIINYRGLNNIIVKD